MIRLEPSNRAAAKVARKMTAATATIEVQRSSVRGPRRLRARRLSLACRSSFALAGFLTSAVARADGGIPPASPCTLRAVETPARALPPDLLRLAAQYFHPTNGSDPFLDLIAGTSRFAYYDPVDPFTRRLPPPSVGRVIRLTERFLVGASAPPAEETVVVNRVTGKETVLRGGHRLHVDDAIEAVDGSLWILGEEVDSNGRPGPLVLLRGDNAAPPRVLTNLASRTWWTSALGVTRRGELAAAWVENGPSPGRVSLRIVWLDSTGHAEPAREIDAVMLPPSYADLSIRTGTNIALARDHDDLAVAWRPLAATAQLADTGDASHPPATPFDATLRLLRAGPKTARLVAAHATVVAPLPGVSGMGPWPLSPGATRGVTLGPEALFLWTSPAKGAFGETIVAARLTDKRPTTVIAKGYDLLLVKRSSSAADRVDFYGYRSAPEFHSFTVTCAP
jgi:hypothetical protein